MSDDAKEIQELSPETHARLAQRVMAAQAKLSLSVATVFLLLLIGLPLFNLYFPAQANTRVLGFPATWLFLGVAFFPITWLLSAYFVRQSDKLEAASSHWRKLTDDNGAAPQTKSEAGR